jgi:hypothetical protein
VEATQVTETASTQALPVAEVRAGRGLGLVIFVALGLIEAAWVFGVPLGAAPDEPAHVLRAVSLWRGDVLPSREDPQHPGVYLVTVPGATVGAVTGAMCSAFHPTVSNRCASEAPKVGPADTQVGSTAARYAPVYYAAVGWPTVFDAGRHGIFAVRMLSGLTCAAMLAAAMATAARARRPMLPMIGAGAAITPMVTGAAAMVNPSAWEISGGILLWSALIGLLGGRVDESRRSLLLKVVVGGSAMLVTRQISVLWVVLIFLTVSLAVGPGALLRLGGRFRRSPIGWGVLGVLLAGAVFEQYWYNVEARTFASPPSGHVSLGDAIVQSTLHLPRWLSQSWGVLGWLDAPTPLLALVSWTVVLGLLLLLAVLGSRGLLRWSVIGAIAVAVVGSIAIESLFWNAMGGYWWQGRYVMPYSMGLPVLCGAAGAVAWRWEARMERSVLRWTSLPLAFFSLLSYFTVVHRYGIGVEGSWLPAQWKWAPPGGSYLMLFTYGLGALWLARIMIRAGGKLSAGSRRVPTVVRGGPPAQGGPRDGATGGVPADSVPSPGAPDSSLPPRTVLARVGDSLQDRLA